MDLEKTRLHDHSWRRWGTYMSDRQWGTVREDYSKNGDPWAYTTHDMARSKAWRWGEEGIGGLCDEQQILCFAPAFWNGKDDILKERFFGLSGPEGSHGEDVKELYYYLEATPTHSYAKMLYKYPQQAFPYKELIDENARRSKTEPEYELVDTGVFDDDAYFDIFIEYAKENADSVFINLTIVNRYSQPAPLHIIPTLWFRNAWSWDNQSKPNLYVTSNNAIRIAHQDLPAYSLHFEGKADFLFCENETNLERLYGTEETNKYYKDGINDHIINGKKSINPHYSGTKAGLLFSKEIPAGESVSIRLRLSPDDNSGSFENFDAVFDSRKKEMEAFYDPILSTNISKEERDIQRMAYAGMLWNKQFYYYNVATWLNGDAAEPTPPPERKNGRNSQWLHLNNADIISMPDKWEFPWYAAWDLAFHCVTLANIDPAFAKRQLRLLTHEWYMHPNGELPAYEWNFSDANPPVHAWATYKIYEIDRSITGQADREFLQTIFHKLIINFTWWVNRKDDSGNNVFEGGFLGMDNIGAFDRSTKLGDATLEQSDGTSWMAMYSLNLMRMALELANNSPAYQDMATKFFEHFMYIAGAMASMGQNDSSLWNEEDEFYYDMLRLPTGKRVPIKLRSMVGLIPLFAVEVLHDNLLTTHPAFAEKLRWFLENKPELAKLVSRWGETGENEMHLLSLLRGHRMKRILYRMLDENEFLSEYGIRSLSKNHQSNPYKLTGKGFDIEVSYSPGESPVDLMGGNSNWRGPIWMPMNYLIIESLRNFHLYYGDDFKVEYPTGSGEFFTLQQISDLLAKRLRKIFLPGENGHRPFLGSHSKLQQDPNFNQYPLFYEYFHGDSGQGLGAAHQTGWTGLIANLLDC